MTATVRQSVTDEQNRTTPASGAPRPTAGSEQIRLPRHLLSAADLNRATAEHVLSTAQRLEQAIAGREVRKLPTLRGRTVVNLDRKSVV